MSLEKYTFEEKITAVFSIMFLICGFFALLGGVVMLWKLILEG